jgi:hypothetical protein
MAEYQNYNSVVVNLEPTENAQTGVRVATYDQAFLGEEFSEARGRGRAKRKARKLSKIADKREVRTARRKLKSDRGEERIARRKTRKEQRQEIRNDQQEARMGRRNKRREEKENKNVGAETDSEEEEEATQQGAETDDREDSDSTDSDYSDSEDTSTSGSGYSNDSAYEDSDSSDSEEDPDEDYEEEETGYSDEADENFAGDNSNFASEVTGKPSVPSAIQTICFQIEMNNEMINQLTQHKKMLEAKSKDTSKIKQAIGQKFDTVQNLESKLQNFSGANGEPDAQKTKVVRIAKAKARKQRIENLPIPPIMLYKLLKKGVSKDKIKQWWEEKGRKNHAEKMNFDGGSDIYGVTNENDYNDFDFGSPAYDYDQPKTQVVDLDSSSSEQLMNFSGGTSSDGYWRSLLIGGLVAFAGIYLIKKYNLLK